MAAAPTTYVSVFNTKKAIVISIRELNEVEILSNRILIAGNWLTEETFIRHQE